MPPFLSIDHQKAYGDRSAYVLEKTITSDISVGECDGRGYVAPGEFCS